MDNITQILDAIERGEPQASAQLLPLVYDELRRVAAAKMAQEKPGQTLVPTALVHEAYLRVIGTNAAMHWKSRGEFFAAAAESMRRILIENARRKKSLKRGGDRSRQELDIDNLPEDELSGELLDLDEALTRLEQSEPEVARLVKLRYFAGLTISDAAQLLGVTSRTADSWWAYARAWLRAALQD